MKARGSERAAIQETTWAFQKLMLFKGANSSTQRPSGSSISSFSDPLILLTCGTAQPPGGGTGKNLKKKKKKSRTFPSASQPWLRLLLSKQHKIPNPVYSQRGTEPRFQQTDPRGSPRLPLRLMSSLAVGAAKAVGTCPSLQTSQ